MSGGRWSASATLLGTTSSSTTSQKVLVAGGITGTSSLATAQLYSQTAGTWVAATNLNAPRHLHTATRLADGRVLVAGGMSGTTTLQTAALYNPASGAGTWTATTGPIPPPGLRFHSASLIQTSNQQLANKVLLVGGNSGSATLSAVYLFDPGQSAFSTLASIPSPRERHTAVTLSGGRILIAGGLNGSTVLSSAIVFDPGSGPGSWSTTGSMTSGRWGHAMNLLPTAVTTSGQVIVSGGSNGTSTLSSTEIWNGASWTLDGAMVAPVQQHASVTLGNKILIAGGAVGNGSTTVSAAELYDPSLGLSCTSGTQCASGFCVSGVCCDSACDGGCGACKLTGQVGTCTPVASGTVCRAAAGACDVAETCNGTSLACPADGFASPSTACRAAAGECDLADNCTGNSPTCPDARKAAGTVCTDDGNVCTTDQCDGTNVACQHPPGNAGTLCRAALSPCDADELCTGTSASCPPDVFQPNGTVCDDGDVCTQTDSCQSGTCTGSNPVVCVAADQCHSPGTCDSASGVCSNPTQVDGTACSDGNACTLADSCQSGVCLPGAAKSCPASDQCHDPGACDPGTGACSTGPAAEDFTPCSDGDLCTRAKACHGGVCSQGQAVCDDGDPCTTDSCDTATGACGHSPLTGDACTAALVAAPPLKGRVSFTTEADNNRCVPDPVHVINRLNAQGELMAWHYDHAGYVGLDDEHFHTETMIRMPYMAGTPLDGSVFVSAWSHPPGSGVGSIMGVAELGFKHGNNGKVLGTNRAFKGVRHIHVPDGFGGELTLQVDSASDWAVTPNPGDTFMPLGLLGAPGKVLDTVQTHPGGGSALGTHVVMGLQGFDDACACSFEGVTITIPGTEVCGCTLNSSVPLIQIWDLAQPLNPVIRSSFVSRINTTDADVLNAAILDGQAGTSAVSSAITKLANGKFLLAVLKDSPSRVAQYEFYLSAGTSLDDPHLWGADNRLPDATLPFGAPGGVGDLSNRPPDWQSFNFMTGCDGSLWVLGMRGDSSGYPDGDAVDNYQVLVTPGGSQATCTTPLCVSFVYAADVAIEVQTDFFVRDGEGTKHMFCPDNSGTDQCDMASGAGSYIGPNGEVIIYSSDYDDDGGATEFVYGNGTPFCTTADCATYGSFSGYIRGKEFHERHGNAIRGSACPTLNDAWVELYENSDYNEFGDDTGQIYRTDYPSRDQRDNAAFGTNDFDGKASSVRWCIPAGSSFAMFDGHLSGSSVVLNGTGHVAEIANFNQPDMVYPHGGGGMNDSITSGQFQPNVVDPQGLVGTPDPSH
jgi:hypothetical protein